MSETQLSEQLRYYIQLHQLHRILPESLYPHLAVCEFEQGEPICTQGEISRYLYILVKGKIKIFNTSTEGRTLVVSFKTPLELIGDVEYVQDIEIINTVEAVSPVVMIRVPYRSLKEHGSDHAPLLRFLLDIITRKFSLKSQFMSFNLIYPVEVRLASYLLSVSFDENDTGFQGKLRTSGLTDAANLIGTSYRHLNRVLRKFAEEGLIERNREYIRVLDREALRERANQNIYEQKPERID
ncbi:Crp/Fnr family transcriptional regulator [Paenibacillus nanensis]|uniref:Crp/Fnr family transcriptional regulator n=1 Tax=Paenibacillus nanensis TaxID=393251 RepID=A0A3A1UWV6_9BACL|nr:Crp/Fnr family transcriptional regulator [Paenibacillus nanensis]RIX51672.1 Crp/Fnr family transcriptional regulator [Paenibacillus nanensis]